MISRMTDIIVTLLPEPDSPTMPRVSPTETVNDTPSTALTTPSSVRKLTRRSRTSSSGSFMTPPLPISRIGPSCWPHSRVERRVGDVDKRVRKHDEECAEDHRGHDHRKVQVGQRLVGQEPDAVNGEHHLGQQRSSADKYAEVEPEQAHERDHRVAQHVADQDAPLGQALRPRGPDVILVLDLEQIGAQHAGVKPDVQDRERYPRKDQALEPQHRALGERRIAKRLYPAEQERVVQPALGDQVDYLA